MEQIYTIASVWLALAVLSAIIAYHLRISIALVEICVGVAAAAVRPPSAKGMRWAPIRNGCVFWPPPGPWS